MGNEQSTPRKRQKANAAETKVQNGEPNGHAVPPSDITEPAVCKEAQQKSESPPVTDTNIPKTSAGKEEVDKAKKHVETSPEKDTTTATDAEPLKPEEVTNFFGKMFKKKIEPVKASSEGKDSVDGQVTSADEKSEIVIIDTEQEEILEEAAGNLRLHLIDTVPTQPTYEDYTCSRMTSNNISEESSSTKVEVQTFSDVLPEPCSTQEPTAVAEEPLTHAEPFAVVSEERETASQQLELHVEKSKGEEISFKAQVPLKYEETTTSDTVQPFIDDKELLKMVEMIIADEEEHLMTNGPESVTSVIDSADDAVKAVIQNKHPVAETEQPLLVAEEIAAIVEEILQITEDQVLGITPEQNGKKENEIRESEAISDVRNNVMDTLDIAETHEMLSVESAVIVEDEMAFLTVESIVSSNGTAAVDEESWVIIEEPASPQNISNHIYPSSPGEEPPSSSTKPDKEQISAETDKCDLTKSTKLFSHLRCVCIDALEDSSYKPVSVDVCGDNSTIHITIDVCPTDKDEFDNNTDFVKTEENDFTHQIQENDVCCSTESVAIKASAEAEPVPEVTDLLEDLVEVTQEILQPEDPKATEKTVMNFFKTFTSSTKTSKEAKATPDASKDQLQKETPPASSANVQEAPKAPPPPPPAPPKMEGKAEPAVKKEETSATAASKAAEASAKTKTKDSAFSKLFRPKMLIGKVVSKVQATAAIGSRAKTSGAPVVVEEKKPVEVQVDASKTSTLEAAAKPEEPPAPKPEEKKPEKKSAFGKMFKPKVLLGQVSTRIQAAASSAAASVSLGSSRAAPEAKKETPAAPAAVESAPITKAKEELKPAGPAAPAAQDNKSVGSTDNSSPSIPRKLEKRNSIQLFFKNLGQKRHSDAGVQTDPEAPEKGPEKAK